MHRTGLIGLADATATDPVPLPAFTAHLHRRPPQECRSAKHRRRQPEQRRSCALDARVDIPSAVVDRSAAPASTSTHPSRVRSHTHPPRAPIRIDIDIHRGEYGEGYETERTSACAKYNRNCVASPCPSQSRTSRVSARPTNKRAHISVREAPAAHPGPLPHTLHASDGKSRGGPIRCTNADAVMSAGSAYVGGLTGKLAHASPTLTLP
ncbi:hypothetical protein C8R44DRAFT_887915 [Mycena epipterygia]|nr:hypothetical protein C8R44DRAFT_887915 [Mycena epipterygia]